MTQTPTYRTVTPYLLVANADAEAEFLKSAFGAVERDVSRHPDGSIMHAELTIGDSLVMLGQAGGRWQPRDGAFYLWVDDVDSTYRRALEAGGRSESEPEDKPYGHRNAGVIDPGGLTWWIAAPVKS